VQAWLDGAKTGLLGEGDLLWLLAIGTKNGFVWSIVFWADVARVEIDAVDRRVMVAEATAAEVGFVWRIGLRRRMQRAGDPGRRAEKWCMMFFLL
jgi:hypothetical protein